MYIHILYLYEPCMHFSVISCLTEHRQPAAFNKKDGFTDSYRKDDCQIDKCINYLYSVYYNER